MPSQRAKPELRPENKDFEFPDPSTFEADDFEPSSPDTLQGGGDHVGTGNGTPPFPAPGSGERRKPQD